jgi:hypothetical protein
MRSPVRKLIEVFRDHFEALLLLYLWVSASVLAVLVGRPWLGAIGFLTVAPVLLAYAVRSR